jgi:hypothetical protein
MPRAAGQNVGVVCRLLEDMCRHERIEQRVRCSPGISENSDWMRCIHTLITFSSIMSDPLVLTATGRCRAADGV